MKMAKKMWTDISKRSQTDSKVSDFEQYDFNIYLKLKQPFQFVLTISPVGLFRIFEDIF